MPQGTLTRLLTVAQLAAELGLPVWRVRELIAQGQAPRHMKIGRTFRFPATEVEAWIAERVSLAQESSHA